MGAGHGLPPTGPVLGIDPMRRPQDQPGLPGLPDWVKSLGLPPEAEAAIDKYWKPVWETLQETFELLPVQPGRAPGVGGKQITFTAVRELQPGRKWQAGF